MTGTIDGVAVIDLGYPPIYANFPALPVASTGVGNVSHLGKVTLTETHTTVISPGPDGGFVSSIQDGQATITAANGDQIFLTFDGSGVETANGFDDTIKYIVTGGTGRFKGASGSGTILSTDLGVSSPFFDDQGNFVETSPFVFDLTGVISSVGSSK